MPPVCWPPQANVASLPLQACRVEGTASRCWVGPHAATKLATKYAMEARGELVATSLDVAWRLRAGAFEKELLAVTGVDVDSDMVADDDGPDDVGDDDGDGVDEVARDDDDACAKESARVLVLDEVDGGGDSVGQRASRVADGG